MTEPVTLQIITTVGLVVVAWLGNRKLNRIDGNAREAREQTANEHADAEFPNMRDEITALHTDVRGLRNDVLALHDEDASLDDTMSRQGIRTQRAIDRAMADSDQQIDRLREEIPVMISRQIIKHVADCPLRTPQIGA